MNKLLGLGTITTLTGLIACTTPGADTVGSSDQNATTDIQTMVRRPDGRFDVTCRDGSQQYGLTAQDINMNRACGGPGTGYVVANEDNEQAPAETCLNTTPIDATQIPYVKAKPKAPRSCTREELTEFGAHYKTHAQDRDFTATSWASSVSATCASCIFTSEDSGPASAWGPIVTKADAIDEINRGGCLEHVSGSEACGRTYQQYQGCLLQACLKDCKTQADFTACRGDQRVLTTACKGAAEAVKAACGAKLTQYETACKGTTYTFEGAIKVACIDR